MVLDEAGKALKDSARSGDNYVILVPDQYSMQTQKEIVTESPQKGILNIDVLSFGRLTHKQRGPFWTTRGKLCCCAESPGSARKTCES